MYFNKSFKGLLLGFVLVFMPSCIKYHKVARTEFPQGQEKDKNKELVENSVRSGRAYDKFTTSAIFDALWLSDEAKKYYVEVYGKKHGYSKEQSDAMLRRQLTENKHTVSFYVLSYIPENSHTALNDKHSIWSPFLKLSGGERVAPTKIEEVEMSPEIQYFFGDKFSRFKVGYFVKFPNKGSNKFDLVFSSVDRDIELSWQEGPKAPSNKKGRISVTNKKINKHEDYYWG